MVWGLYHMAVIVSLFDREVKFTTEIVHLLVAACLTKQELSVINANSLRVRSLSHYYVLELLREANSGWRCKLFKRVRYDLNFTCLSVDQSNARIFRAKIDTHNRLFSGADRRLNRDHD